MRDGVRDGDGDNGVDGSKGYNHASRQRYDGYVESSMTGIVLMHLPTVQCDGKCVGEVDGPNQ